MSENQTQPPSSEFTTEFKAELPDCRPYLITPRSFDPVPFSALLAEALDAGHVNCAQVWMPGAETDDVKRALEVLAPVCHQRDVALLVCDHVDLVSETGADGVHLGKRPEDAEDVSDVVAARKALGDDMIVGASCYTSRHRALEAAEKNADYVSFGPCFPGTDTSYDEYLSTELLAWWNAYIEVPSVAVAGITAENCADLVRAGVDFLAVSGTVWNHPDGPGKAVAEINAAIQQAANQTRKPNGAETG
jgi:thiamine-phosphate pyrophosphorylase